MLKNQPITESDREQIAAFIAADPDHAERTDVDFWMPKLDSLESLHYAVTDEKGVVMYVRLEKLLRVHVQFAPPSEKSRIAAALDQFLTWIKIDAKRNHYTQVIFESVFRPLIKFTKKYGFHESPNEHVAETNR